MSDFLWEIGCEEIPARMQKSAEETLERLIRQHSQNLTFQNVQTYSSPRRLAIRLYHVGTTVASSEIKKGPFVHLGDKAFKGFCRTWSIDPAVCTQVDTPKGLVWSATIVPKEQPLESRLIALCTGVLNTMFWPKRMRWSGSAAWIRPIRWMVALYEDCIVDWSWNEIVAGSWSEAHRLAPHANFFHVPVDILHQKSSISRFGMKITRPETYVVQLAHSGVIVDRHVRCERIRQDVINLAAAEGGIPYAGDTFEALIEENSGLTQWPQAILCTFDPEFLKLPPEVIVTTLQVHQKCFCIQSSENNSLLPYFIMIADGPLPPESVKEGYQRVVAARLADALFFWNQDLKIPLGERIPELQKRSFFQDLGSFYDKTQRLQRLMLWIAQHTLQVDYGTLAEQTGCLSKCDLLTAMVGEFPILQGVMGKYYAENQGVDLKIACALQESYAYARQSIHDLKKYDLLGAWLAIADGVDTLVGFFALGRIPSGSKDPMALRRACHGVIKAMVAQKVSFDLSECIDFALKIYQDQGFLSTVDRASIERLIPFFHDRLEHLLSENGILIDHTRIKTLVRGNNMLDIWRGTEQWLMLSQRHPDFLAAYHRVEILVKSMEDYADSNDFSILNNPLERQVIKVLESSLDCTEMIKILPHWTHALNTFLDGVKVQEEPYTLARINLLRHALNGVSFLMGSYLVNKI